MFYLKIALFFTILCKYIKLFDGAVTVTSPTANPYSLSLPEGNALNHEVVKIVVTKPDANAIAWTLGGVHPSFFEITPVTGNDKEGSLKLKKVLDYETTRSLSVTINIAHGGTTKSVRVILYVTDVNDNAPDCGTSMEVAVKYENETGILSELSCNDKDSGDNAVMNCTTTHTLVNASFADSKCTVKLPNAIDFETIEANPLIFDVIVSDTATNVADRKTATISYILAIMDLFDVAPTFSQAYYTCKFNENVEGFCTSISVTDKEYGHSPADNVTCSIAGPNSDKFSINPLTCLVKINAPIDREAPGAVTNFPNLLIIATDRGLTASTATLSVGIVDVNDNTPICNTTDLAMNRSESFTGPIAELYCSDKDAGYNAKLICITYAKNFSTTLKDSKCTLNLLEKYDFETMTTQPIVLTLHVTDSAQEADRRKIEFTYSLTITDVFDVAPVFNQTTYDCILVEETTNSCSMISVMDIETAHTPPDAITCTLSGTNSDKFDIVSPSCHIKPKIGGIDRDTGSANPRILDVEIVATDKGSNAATATLSVTITDVNDNTPICTPATITDTKSETYTGALIPLSCTDKDADKNSQITCSTSETRVTVNSNTCAVSLPSPIDRETLGTNPIKFDVIVKDNAIPESTRKTSTVSYTLVITDANDNTPSCAPTSLTSTKPESYTGDIFQTPCSDRDEGQNSQLTCSSSTTGITSQSFASVCVTRITSAIDYETIGTNPFSFEVVVSDRPATGKKSMTLTYTLEITDVFDAAPVFSQTTYTCSLEEETTTPCTTISVTDVETSHTPADAITCTLSGPNSDKFDIISPSCQIKSKTSDIDREATGVVTSYPGLKIVATDKGSNKATATVSVTITDVNDNAPVCTPATITDTKSEYYTGVLTPVSCTDKDEGNNAVLACSTSETKVTVDSIGNTCAISLPSAIDRETMGTNPMKFDVLIRDNASPESGRKTTTVSYTLSITDENDNTPSCSTTILSTKKSEQFTGAIFSASCNDPDTALNGQMTCSTSETKVATVMSGTNCVTQIYSPIDYETLDPNPFNFEVVVSDSPSTGKKSITLTYTLEILGVNDHVVEWRYWEPPYTDADTVIKTIPESAPVDTKLFTLVATDIDKGPDGDVVYSIINATANTGENVKNSFKIGSSTGIAKVAIADLNREKYEFVSITVSASDGTNTLTRTAKIAITDISDEAPEFTPNSGIYSSNINENVANAGATVTTIVVRDPDVSPSPVTCSIVSGNTDTLFELASGYVIKLKNDLNIDKPTSHPTTYKLMVDCHDGLLTSTATVSVSILDNINDYAPVVTNSDQTITVAEDKALGEIASFSVSDRDYGVAGTVTCSLTSPSTLFSTSCSKLNLISPLDYETAKTHIVTIKVKDGFTSNPKEVTATVTVSVTNINDNEPKCTPTTHSINVPESAVVGTKLYTIPCSDLDETPAAGKVGIISGDDDDRFIIGGIADLKLFGTLDYERNTQYVLHIKYIESSAPYRPTTMTLTVNINPVNEATPICNPVTVSATMRESQIVGSNIGSPLVVVDSDKGNDGVIAYSLKTLTDTFSVSSSGQLQLKKLIDYETMGDSKVLSVKVEVKDTGGTPKSSTCTVDVTVTDVNDNEPVCIKTLFTSSIAEDIGKGTPLIGGIVTATDADISAPHNEVKYSLVAGDTTDSFMVNATTGQVRVMSSTPTGINYEVAQSYTLKVKARDGAGSGINSVTCSLSISVTDVNEGAPTFGIAADTINLLENTTTGTVVYTKSATDIDTLQTVTYSISPSTHFSVDSLGKVSLTTALDYETKTKHTLSIKAVDNGVSPSALTGTYTLTVSVKDFNEGTPTFTPTTKTVTVVEDTAIGKVVHTQTASDTDTSQTLTYSISPSTHFNVDSLGKVSVTASLDYETTTKHTLTIKATDNGVLPSALTGTYTLTVFVAKSNENHPICSVTPAIGSINENATVDALVATFNCTDADQNVTLTYHTNKAPFKMSGIQLKLANASVLDYEAGPRQYIVPVEIRDDEMLPKKTTTISYVINVGPVNEHQPAFNSPQAVFSIPESSTVQTIIGTVTATDSDRGANHGTLTYSIESGNTAGKFAIDSVSGKLILAKTIDFETEPKVYSLVVTAVDGEGEVSTVYVTVSVTDVNDNSPKFTQVLYNMEIAYDVTDKYSIGSIKAYDDANPNVVIIYTWKESVKNFDLDLYNGNISKTDGSILTPGISYVFHVVASANGNPKTSTEATVRIDTFEPRSHVIAITVNVAKFDEMLPTILTLLQSTLKTKYPKCKVKHMYKVTANMTSSQTNLQNVQNSIAQYTKSYYYVVSDSTTESMSGLNTVKTLVPVSELQSLWKSDSSGNPSPIFESSEFGNISIVRIEDYVPVTITTQSSTSVTVKTWIESPYGIALVIVLCLFVLIVIIFGVYLWYSRKRARVADSGKPDESNQEAKEVTGENNVEDVRVI